MPISILLKFIPAIAALSFIAIAFIAGYRYNDALHEKEKAQLIIKSKQDLQNEIDQKHKISLEYEKKIQEMAMKVRTVVKTVEVEIEKPIYKDCVLPSSGIATINTTAENYNKNRSVEKINETAEKMNIDRNKK